MKAVGYEKYEEYRALHREIIVMAIKEKDAVDSTKSTEKSMQAAIEYIVGNAIIGHIIKADFDFFPLLRQ